MSELISNPFVKSSDTSATTSSAPSNTSSQPNSTPIEIPSFKDATNNMNKEAEETQKFQEELDDRAPIKKEEFLSSTPETDSRSIYVGNVDFAVSAEQLAAFFSSCGPIKRATILSTKKGHPKGAAYLEFGEKESVEEALKLDGAMLNERKIKVLPKRTNIMGYKKMNGMGRDVRKIGGGIRGMKMMGGGQPIIMMIPPMSHRSLSQFMSSFSSPYPSSRHPHPSSYPPHFLTPSSIGPSGSSNPLSSSSSSSSSSASPSSSSASTSYPPNYPPPNYPPPNYPPPNYPQPYSIPPSNYPPPYHHH